VITDQWVSRFDAESVLSDRRAYSLSNTYRETGELSVLNTHRTRVGFIRCWVGFEWSTSITYAVKHIPTNRGYPCCPIDFEDRVYSLALDFDKAALWFPGAVHVIATCCHTLHSHWHGCCDWSASSANISFHFIWFCNQTRSPQQKHTLSAQRGLNKNRHNRTFYNGVEGRTTGLQKLS